jgi:predicted PolB exonuclease-like 3'-5' exonuclease
MTFRVIDIETVPLAASMAAPYPAAERQPPANYRNADAIDAWRERDRLAWAQERAKTCSLSPRLGRVLCVGMATAGDEAVYYAATEDAEREVLRSFWDEVNGYKVVTWNGSWDLRFLVVRSLLLGVTIPVDACIVRAWAKPYNTDFAHCDVKRVLVGDGIVKGEGLDEWAAAFGLPGKTDGWSGASVYPAYLDGRHAEIADYCRADVAATRALYLRLAHLVED